MAVEEKDPVSGQKTTGHEWNGIKELDTPVPLGILIFIVVTHVWALLWWVLMPTFPLGTTYTKGILDTDQRKIVELDLTEAQAQRAARMKAIETSSYEDILANEDLMKLVRTTGQFWVVATPVSVWQIDSTLPEMRAVPGRVVAVPSAATLRVARL